MFLASIFHQNKACITVLVLNLPKQVCLILIIIMAGYTIYAWGNGSEIAPFDVASTLLAALITKNDLSTTVKIIPNSNIFDSHSGRLPFMISNSENQVQHEGLIDIWKTMCGNCHVNTPHLSGKDKVLFMAYLNDLVKNLDIITLYNFFVVKRNYEGYTRGSFQQLLPWPTQYKPPVDIRIYATELCYNMGIVDDGPLKSGGSLEDSDAEDELTLLRKEEVKLRDTPVMNDLQKSQMDKELDIINQKKSIIANMHCIKMLKDVLRRYEELKDSFDPEYQHFFELVIHTYVKCNTSSNLPENFLQVWLQKEQPTLYSKICSPSSEDCIACIQLSSKIPLTVALKSYLGGIV
jgi:sorting and assembly machinery component 37